MLWQLNHEIQMGSSACVMNSKLQQYPNLE